MKRIFVLLVILALIPLTCADPTADSLSVGLASGDPGATYVPIPVVLTNVVDGPIQGITFEVTYDGGVIELAAAAAGSDLPEDFLGNSLWDVKLGADKKCITMYTDDQSYALADGTTGNILTLYFNVHATATPGEYPIGISNVDISSTELVHGTIPVINGAFTVNGTVVDPVLCTDPDPPSNDFGNVLPDETRTWTFDVSNSGAGTLDWTVADDQDWITVSPESGSDAGTVTVTIDTAGLADGAYTGNITVGSSYGTRIGTIDVNVESGAHATSVSIADITAALGDVVVVPLMLNDITDFGTGTINITYDPLVVHVTNVADSSDSVIAAFNNNNAAGFTTISASNIGGASGDIVFANVEFTAVGSGGDSTLLNLAIDSLYDRSFNVISATISDGSFTIQSSTDPALCTTPDPPSNDFGNVPVGETRTWTFDITNSGGGTLDWTVVDDQDWITVSPESGSDAGTVTVTINTTGLADGVYDGAVNVSSNGGTKEGTIRVTVSPASVDPVLCTTPDPPLNDFGSVPAGETRTWTFDITNSGGGTLDWTVVDDQDWITVSPESGSDAGTVTVTIDTTGLAVGAHTGAITVGSSYGTKTGTISVDVTDPASPPGTVVTIPDVSATGMITVPITVENVSNVGSCQLTLSYDPAVVIVSSASKFDFDSLFANLEGAASGNVSLLAYQTASPGLSGDVIVANVTFLAVGNSGSSTTLDLEVTTFTDATPACKPIPYTITDGSFTMFLNGDVNGDSRVDVADCMFLAKHLLGATGFETIVEDAADVNGNGAVEASDCMYLAKHLAGIDGFGVLK